MALRRSKVPTTAPSSRWARSDAERGPRVSSLSRGHSATMQVMARIASVLDCSN